MMRTLLGLHEAPEQSDDLDTSSCIVILDIGMTYEQEWIKSTKQQLYYSSRILHMNWTLVPVTVRQSETETKREKL